MSRQNTSHLLMIRPVQFTFNEQTAGNNAFQSQHDYNAQELALKEFDDFAVFLIAKGIDVTIINDTEVPRTPDSIFPNNWISFHEDGSIYLYPMFAENRRLERKPHILEKLKSVFETKTIIDLSEHEKTNRFLEGTGSMVLDRQHQLAYACLSERTHEDVIKEFCHRSGFRAVMFNATDAKNFPIYHTNVMMCIAEEYAIVCLETIRDDAERNTVTEVILGSDKKLITINLDQVNHFAGNMLQVRNNKDEKFLVMSSQAFHALTPEQIQLIELFNPILHSSLDTIERNGGGSARCMMAEIFLPVKPLV